MKERIVFALALSAALPLVCTATENLPQIPFAQTAIVPDENQLIVTPWYAYSVFRKVWIGEAKTSIEIFPKDDFELNDGMVRLDYGLTERLALDLNLGATSAATRAWNPRNVPQTTQGLIDTQLGVRYRFLDGQTTNAPWYVPTLTGRVGGIIKGNYIIHYPMAPGDGASGFELDLLMTKTTPWYGLGVYGNFGWRIFCNEVPETIFGSAGLSETLNFHWVITSVSLFAGYRASHDLSGGDFSGPGLTSGSPYDYVVVGYRPTAQETYQLAEVGLGLSDKWGHSYFFSCSAAYDGRNTGKNSNFIIGMHWPLNL